MNIDVHIDRLVFEGVEVPHGARPALRAAVERELARLIVEGGLSPGLAAGGAVPAVPAPTIEWLDRAGAAELGQRVARAVYGGIGR